MRLLTGVATAAVAGLALANQEPAEVYLFKSSSQSSHPSDPAPRIPKEIARHIFLQRTSRDRYGSPLRDIPITLDEETAVSYVNTFGTPRPSMFDATEQGSKPAQLVVILEGVTGDNSAPLKESMLSSAPVFIIPDPPSAAANNRLMSDFLAEGVGSKPGCEIDAVINPNDKSCWDGTSVAVKYDVQKSPDVIETLASNIERLQKFVSSGELEALFVLLPESSRSSRLSSWSSSHSSSSSQIAAELRRREGGELVITDEPSAPAPTSANRAAEEAFWASNQEKGKARLQNCYLSLNACVTNTNNCSDGHGLCFDRNANTTSKSQRPCFSCHCMSTIVSQRGPKSFRTVRWGGRACQKKDISVQFWLLAGFTITIVGAVTFAIGLLYSVGEEKLPGVIGAGVSRSK